MNTTQIKELAQLSQASYAYFDSIDFAVNDPGQNGVLAKLEDKDKGAFTDKEARLFRDRYEVVHQYRDTTTAYGFSATVFRDKANPSRLIFSVRGTEIPIDITNDLFISDLQIGTAGYAKAQAVPLYRYFKQLQTAGGQAVSYTENELQRLYYLSQGHVVDLSITVESIAYNAFKTNILQDKGISAGQAAGTAVITSNVTVEATGHSLGGHLALLLDRLFPGNLSQVTTFNAPGFYAPPMGLGSTTQVESMLSQFGGWNTAHILRIEAAGDGVSEIGTVFPGSRMLIAQEDGGLGAAISSNHSIVNSADGLAVTELLGKLDPTIANDPRLAKGLIDRAANTYGMSYESTLDALRKLLLGSAIMPTPQNNGITPTSRDSLYVNIAALQANTTFIALQGKIQIVIPPADGLSAKTDFGALLSLVYLTPFSLKPADATSLATLKSAQTSLAAQWDADQVLTGEERAQGRANFSDLYLADRAAMLSWRLKVNTGDLVGDVAPNYQGDSWHFKDEASGTQVWVGNPLYVVSDPTLREVKFGQSGVDNLSGSDNSDHLYGGAGNDTLNGGKGNDYLEGQLDDDTLKGEDGRDTLMGGAGMDILNGGKHADLLQGGLGNDTYQFASNDGNDIIDDTDGLGHIEINGTQLATLTANDYRSPGNWIKNGVTYTFNPDANGTGTLLIQSSAGVTTVKHFKNGQLGINLPSAPAATTPPAVNLTLTGDLTPILDANLHYQYDGLGNLIVSATPLPGFADTLYGGTGNDIIDGKSGDDYLQDVLGGDDKLTGGAGSDILQSGAGKDTLLGGAGADISGGKADDDKIYAESEISIEAAFTQGATQAANNLKGDWLDGGAGNDTLIGNAGNDALSGGDNDDIMLGGGGDDNLMGDETLGNGTSIDWTIARAVVQKGTVTHYQLTYNQAITSLANGGNDVMYGQAGDDMRQHEAANENFYREVA